MLTAAGATGQLVFLPLLAWLAENHGWRSAAIATACAAQAHLAGADALFAAGRLLRYVAASGQTCIAGSRLLNQAYHDYLLTLDRATPLVFQCHRGIRSQSAAEYCQGLGFENLFNLRGGIDAWSLLVDPSVPRY